MKKKFILQELSLLEEKFPEINHSKKINYLKKEIQAPIYILAKEVILN